MFRRPPQTEPMVEPRHSPGGGGTGFPAVYSNIGYINQSLWVENTEGIIFQETDQLVEDFI